MTDPSPPAPRSVPGEVGVVAGVAGTGGAATPSFAATSRELARTTSTTIGGRRFDWGSRTYVMGIVNATPDSFSGDGLLAVGGRQDALRGEQATAFVDRAVALARRMIDEGADILDVGGESTRPGHDAVSATEEHRRVVPIITRLRAEFPETPLSIDTTKPDVAAAALDAGASMLNDVWGVSPDAGLARLAADRGVPIVLMHNRAEARYANLIVEVLAELQAAVERAIAVGVPPDAIIVDPGFGFGKAPDHNLALLDRLDQLRLLGRPILLGTSRKSTLGKVLDLPPEERLEATLATTALAVRAGVDIVRVHDVGPNLRAARMADAVVRRSASSPDPSPGDAR